MKTDFVKIAWKNLWNRKIRSLLTVIGIIIGIAAIVGLISIGNGLNNAIEEQFEKIGSNRIFIMAKGGLTGASGSLTTEDVETLEKMPDFVYVTPYLFESVVIRYGNEKYNYNLIGFPSDDAEGRFQGMDISVRDGRYFTDKEENVVMLGHLIAKDGFKQEIRINNNIEINGRKMKVVGIFDEIGNPEDDNQIYAPIDAAREIFDQHEIVNVIDLVVKDGKDIDQIVKKIERVLERKRGDDNFDVSTPEQILAQLGNVTLIVQIVLVGIAAISLIVGGIGIMNSVYTSVLERRKEIGIMKSIGATNSDILWVFLIEAGIMGLIGGVVGVIVGSSIAWLVGYGAAQAGFSLLLIKINPLLILFGMSFAFIVGVFSGFLPAKKATKLKPVDALRL